jgi:hypothetical protein
MFRRRERTSIEGFPPPKRRRQKANLWRVFTRSNLQSSSDLARVFTVTALMAASHPDDSELGGARETGLADQHCLVADNFVLGVGSSEMA